MKETYPLQWPEGWPRTRPQDRKERTAWKKNDRQSTDALELELKRFGVISSTISRKDPSDFRGAADPSISLHFSRHRTEDFSWQDALDIHNPAPETEEIESAWRRLAAKYHPDNKQTGDVEMFRALTVHANNARAYINRLSGKAYDYVIACDTYTQPKWNINAIKQTIHSLRQMERDGTSALLQQAMKGFQAQIGAGEPIHASTAS